MKLLRFARRMAEYGVSLLILTVAACALFASASGITWVIGFSALWLGFPLEAIDHDGMLPEIAAGLAVISIGVFLGIVIFIIAKSALWISAEWRAS